MLPLAIMSLVCLVVVLVSFLYGLITLQFSYVLAALVAALPTLVGLYISGKLLYRVTRGRRNGSGSAPIQQRMLTKRARRIRSLSHV